MRKTAIFLLLAGLCIGQSGPRGGVDRSMLDPTCKACDDFYRYATGGWTDKNPIPADRSNWGTFSELQEANLEREKTILDASAAPGNTGDQRKLGDFFTACMNTQAIEAAAAKPLEPLFNRIAAIRTRKDLAICLVGLGWRQSGQSG